MKDVSIIIVSYNTKELTLACIKSILKETKSISYEIIVVDNASTDGSPLSIRSAFPDIKLIISDENLGFARANNLAVRQAIGNYILLLNPDTFVIDGAIQKLYFFALNNPSNMIYGGRTLFENHSLNKTSCWGKPTLWSLFCYSIGLTSVFRQINIFNPEAYCKWQCDSVRTVDIVTGCFLMIPKSFWVLLGGFDPNFFMYGEDADLCLRGLKAGAKPIVTPEATIIHYCGASEKIKSDMMIRLYRAKEQLINKHWSPVPRWFGLKMIRFSVFSRALFCNLFSSKKFKICSNKESWKEIWQRRGEWINR